MRLQAEEDNAAMEQGLMAACGGRLNKFDLGGAMDYIKNENIGNKAQIAAAMDAYINKYMRDSKAKDSIKYRDAYNAIIKGQGNFRNPTQYRSEKDARKHFGELVDLGMNKRVAFGLAFPQISKQPNPGSAAGYDVENYDKHTANRNKLYNELVRGNSTNTASQTTSTSANNTANTSSGNGTTWGTSASGLHTRTRNGKTSYRASNGKYYSTEQKALDVNRELGNGSASSNKSIDSSTGKEVPVTWNNVDNSRATTATGLNPYSYDPIEQFRYWDANANDYNAGYRDFINNINDDWINRVMSGQYGDMSRYRGANNVNPTVAQARQLGLDRMNSDWHKAMAAAYDDYKNGVDPTESLGDRLERNLDASIRAQVDNYDAFPNMRPAETPLERATREDFE